MRCGRATRCALACCVLLVVLASARARSFPSESTYFWPGPEGVQQLEPGEIAEMIDALSNMIQLERTNTKRGLDLGLSRGYSGALQAKHLMGLAAANFAEGPGRRRRSARL